MGFIKAFTGALSGTFADQWLDYYAPRPNMPATAAFYQAVPQGQNAGVGENTKGNENIISNGSKIIVPEGTALITIQDGAITGCIAEPGGFIYRSDDPSSQSIFAGDGIVGPLIKSTWEKVKFGGQPGAQQLAFYVNLKEIPGNRFGTQTPIYWYDEYLATKAGGSVRGTYSLKIVDPLLFVKQYLPASYYQPGAPVFDFDNIDIPEVDQLFQEFMLCLTPAFKRFSLNAKQENKDTLEYVQENLNVFSNMMDEEVEKEKQWTTTRGLKVVSVALQADYDGPTLEVLDEIRAQDAEIRKATRMGQAYSNNMAGMMAAASGQAMQAAASNEAGAMMGFMGMNMAQNAGVNMLGAVNNMQPQQPVQQQPMAQPQQVVQPQPAVATPEQAPVAQPETQQPAEDPYAKLTQMKKLLDDGVISQADFDAAKNKLLGL